MKNFVLGVSITLNVALFVLAKSCMESYEKIKAKYEPDEEREE